MHHLSGNIRTEPHDVLQLEVRCQPCHTGLVKKTTRQSWPERQEFLKVRAKIRPIGSDR